mmetsp:Transcript_13803/g.40417  ORF Transcript_13803/g.40417 Transcript_13803/m.40417 type:complete len:265 (+) Transcript_13803:1397-2191(+)
MATKRALDGLDNSRAGRWAVEYQPHADLLQLHKDAPSSLAEQHGERRHVASEATKSMEKDKRRLDTRLGLLARTVPVEEATVGALDTSKPEDVGEDDPGDHKREEGHDAVEEQRAVVHGPQGLPKEAEWHHPGLITRRKGVAKPRLQLTGHVFSLPSLLLSQLSGEFVEAHRGHKVHEVPTLDPLRRRPLEPTREPVRQGVAVLPTYILEIVHDASPLRSAPAQRPLWPQGLAAEGRQRHTPHPGEEGHLHHQPVHQEVHSPEH